MWDIWQDFCHTIPTDPYLHDTPDPIPVLQLFAHSYRTGAVAPTKSQVCSRTMEDALRAVGQAFATLGCPDPRLQPSSKLDFRLSHQLARYKKDDPPPTRVKPILFPIIANAADLCYTANTPASSTIADLLLLSFYFLLCPGEYAAMDNEDISPFCYCDIHFLVHDRHLNHFTCPDADLHHATYIALEFTNQTEGN
jgi:hypothetical protein